MATIMGQDLQLFVSGKTLGCATSCSVEINSDDIDISCKDTGDWGATKRGKMSWTASSDDLMVVADYSKLVDAMIAGTALDLVYSTVSNKSAAQDPDEDGHITPTDGWKKNNDMYYGKATISSISLTAGNGEIATYTVNFNGVGKLTKSTGTADK